MPHLLLFHLDKKIKSRINSYMILGNAHKKTQTCFKQLSCKNLVLANKGSGSVAGAGSRGSGKGGGVSGGLQPSLVPAPATPDVL